MEYHIPFHMLSYHFLIFFKYEMKTFKIKKKTFQKLKKKSSTLEWNGVGIDFTQK